MVAIFFPRRLEMAAQAAANSGDRLAVCAAWFMTHRSQAEPCPGDVPVPDGQVRASHRRSQPGLAGQLARAGEPGDVPDLGEHHQRGELPDAGQRPAGPPAAAAQDRRAGPCRSSPRAEAIALHRSGCTRCASKP